MVKKHKKQIRSANSKKAFHTSNSRNGRNLNNFERPLGRGFHGPNGSYMSVHSMREEAQATLSHGSNRIFAKEGYRNLPVRFIKASEIYDPSDFIKSLAKKFDRILSEDVSADIKVDVVSENSPFYESAEFKDLEPDKEVLDNESFLESELDDAISELEDRNMEAEIIKDLLADSSSASDLDERAEENLEEENSHSSFENEVDLLLNGNTTSDNENFDNFDGGDSPSENGDFDNETAKENIIDDENLLLKGKSSGSNSASDSDSNSEFDENNIAELEFLITRDMQGSHDIYIEDEVLDGPKNYNSKSTKLKNIKRIIKTQLNFDNELQFTVLRNVGKSVKKNQITYTDLALENSHFHSPNEFHIAIKRAGGIINTDSSISTKEIPSDLADVINTLQKFQGPDNKRTRKAGLKLEEYATSFDNNYQKKANKNKKRVPSFSAADPSLRSEMIESWHRNQASKASKNYDREVDRHKGKLSRFYKEHGFVELKDAFPQFMYIRDIQKAFDDFILINTDMKSLPFPAMSSRNRRIIKDMAEAYYLTSNTIGSGKHKYLQVTKTSRTSYESRDHGLIELILKTFTGKKFACLDAPTGNRELAKQQKRNNIGQKATKFYNEGDIVGENAQEIDDNNIGKRMLRSLGWTDGMSLGTGNIGIMAPLEVKVKTKKHGIGLS